MKKSFFKKSIKKSMLILFVFFFYFETNAQGLKFPDVSQKAFVTQTIGVTDIEIDYHSPLAKNRKVFGGIVPFNKVWRCGANENTTISFSTDVKIEGKQLKAGIYGLHMIPSENDWIIIFSNNYTSWGSFTYKIEEDEMRVTVKPAITEFQEWLSYDFSERKANSVVIDLKWENVKVSFLIEVDLNNTILAGIRRDLRGSAGQSLNSWIRAASFCERNNYNLEEALSWIEVPLQANPSFSSLKVKASILEKMGKTAEANEIRKKAIEIAGQDELNLYGYELLQEKQIEKAINIFKVNVSRNPSSWNVYDSLGEAYLISKDNKNAKKYYKIALSKAPLEQQPGILERMKETDIL